jgi:hypothetical protein
VAFSGWIVDIIILELSKCQRQELRDVSMPMWTSAVPSGPRSSIEVPESPSSDSDLAW